MILITLQIITIIITLINTVILTNLLTQDSANRKTLRCIYDIADIKNCDKKVGGK